VRVRVLVNTLKDAVTIPPRRQRLFREFAITVRRADRVSRSSALPPNRNSLAGATRTPLAGAQPVRAGGIQRAPRSRLLQTSTLEGAPGTAKAGYAEDPPQGGFGPSAACAVAPQRSTITAVRNGFTRPQPLAFANDSSAPRHSGARRVLPPIGSEPFALQLNACTGWFRRLYREGIPHNASWEIKVYWLEGWAICPISIVAFAAASARPPAELRHGLRRGPSIDCPRSTSS
jgi:hypothetical protein